MASIPLKICCNWFHESNVCPCLLFSIVIILILGYKYLYCYAFVWKYLSTYCPLKTLLIYFIVFIEFWHQGHDTLISWDVFLHSLFSGYVDTKRHIIHWFKFPLFLTWTAKALSFPPSTALGISYKFWYIVSLSSVCNCFKFPFRFLL